MRSLFMILVLVFGFSMLSGCTCHFQAGKVDSHKCEVIKCVECNCPCDPCHKCTCKVGECKCKDCPGIAKAKAKPKKKCCENHDKDKDEKKDEVLPEPKKVEDCPEKN